MVKTSLDLGKVELQVSQVRFSSAEILCSSTNFMWCFYRAEDLTACVYNKFETDGRLQVNCSLRNFGKYLNVCKENIQGHIIH